MGYFEDRLLKLLPQVHRLEDNGDLRDFLRVFAPTLDWLKAKIDDFPVLWDLDRVPAKFLPFLGALVRFPYVYTRDPELQRKLIKFRIEFYRRKGTRASLERILEENGVDAPVVENQPWEAVYKIPLDDPVHWLADLLEEVHPAGTKWVFYCHRMSWATLPAPETHMARILILAATASEPTIGRCPVIVTVAGVVQQASEPGVFCALMALATATHASSGSCALAAIQAATATAAAQGYCVMSETTP
jgi:phage tail-like protein